jgi:hypothetical protein
VPTPPPCFDASLARDPTRTLAVADVIDLLAVPHAPERIEEYRLAMLRGDHFPPVSVVRLAGRFFLADGHKRFSAYRQIGASEIVVEVWPVRRWMRDQLGQLGRKARLQASLAVRSVHDPAARADARALGRHFLAHGRRIARSLGAALRGRLW